MSKGADEQKKWYVKFELYIAAACLALFSVFVLVSLNRSSIWHDEGYSAVLIENSYPGIVRRTALDVHPPLYYIALKTWSLVFGDSSSVLRLYSAVCMLGAIVITWRLVKKLYGTRAGLVALLFMCMGPFLVRYGQEMRMYGQAALLASIATWLFVDSLTNPFTRKRALLYGATIAAGMYTQYFFILVPAAHVLYALCSAKVGAKKRILALKAYVPSVLTAAALYIMWVPIVVWQFREVQGAFWIGPVGVETLTSTPLAMTILKKQFELTGVEGLLAVVTLGLIILVVRQFVLKHRDSSSKLLAYSVIVPPVVLFLLSVPPLQPSYQDRYMSFLAPVFYSVLALGALALTKRRAKIVVLAALSAVMVYGQWNNYWNGNNHGWSPKPTFTMNSIVDQIDDNSQVYSTTLWTYFDAHVTMRDRGFVQTPQLLLKDLPTDWHGNWSAVYERPELLTTSIPSGVNSFWLIDESGGDKYTGEALKDFYQQRSYFVNGYAKLTKFVRNQ